MASLIQLLGSQDVVNELGAMITEKVEVAIAHALGDFELDENSKILPPIAAMIQREVALAIGSLNGWEATVRHPSLKDPITIQLSKPKGVYPQ